MPHLKMWTFIIWVGDKGVFPVHTGLRELTLFDTLTDVPVNESWIRGEREDRF